MRISASLFDPKVGRVIGICSYVAYSVCAAIAILWAGRSVYLGPKTHLLQIAAKEAQTGLVMARRDLVDLKTGPKKPSLPVGADVVQAFQTEVVTEAQKEHCTVVQFNAPATSSGFANHYGASAAGVSAYHIRVSFAGDLKDMLTMLGNLADQDIPFEFTSFDFSPTGGASPNNVLAQVEFDALSRTEA